MEHFQRLLGLCRTPLAEAEHLMARARTARQQQLIRRGCHMTFYIHEYALRLPAGNAERSPR